MKTRYPALIGAVLAAALALPAAAGAALPKAPTTLIVPGKSLGGIVLGTNSKAVEKAWGKTKECVYQCLYEGAKGGDETAATASVLLEEPASMNGTYKVWRVFITVGLKQVGDALKPDFDTPLVDFKTSKGIGIGSKVAEVQSAYPSAKRFAGGGIKTFTIMGKGEIETSFTCSGPKVTTVTVSSHRAG